MTRPLTHSLMLLAAGGLAVPAFGQFVDFEMDNSRIDAPSNLVLNDSEEKDYAFGDLDNDGDIDLVIVRKQPFTSTGKRTNVLLMNESGVLTDRTSEYATASDIPGDNGFETATNDRDVLVIDVDGDGWLDMVTAPTLTDNQAKHMSHPRVYMNLGEQGGVWQGFEYQDARIPEMHPTAGPRFCSVAGADITEDGDGLPDLYFGDYDSGGNQIFDYNNKLLINDGNGFFTDESNDRLTSTMRLSAFGAASFFGDFNGDGSLDILKQTSLNAPTHVAVTYNNPTNPGFFNFYDTIYDAAPYFVNTGDLNNDGKLDMVIVDDGGDVTFINEGNDGGGHATFSSHSLQNSGGFGGNAYIEDLNQDGLDDVLVTDVDVDISGCSRTTLIYRNLGGPNATMSLDSQVIPANMLNGVHDAAIFDINGDGWKDIVMGRCNSTEVWMNVPPIGLVFNYPNGLPTFLTPGETTEVTVSVEAFGGGVPDMNSGTLYVSIDGGPFSAIAMDTSGDTFTASLPALECTQSASYYFEASLEGGLTFTDPPNAPGTSFNTVAADDFVLVSRDEIEGSVDDWTVENVGVDTGGWEQADPNGTEYNDDNPAPENDATAGADNTMCFVTENGVAGGAPGDADLDGGPTRLISPQVDLDGTDGSITFARWHYSALGSPDAMTVQISNDDGDSWTAVPEMTTIGTSDWETVSFIVGDYIEPTGQIRVRFTVSDSPNDSLTESGIDNFQVDRFECDGDVVCPADTTGDGMVDVSDLTNVILAWGSDDPAADVDGNGVVDVSDLTAVILAWGACGG